MSIQAHPEKELAKELHARDPKNYKDSNHKPEMAIALTPFEALCGFRPLEEIIDHLHTIPELASLVKRETVESLIEAVQLKDENERKKALKRFFAEFIAAEKNVVVNAIKLFEARIMTMNRATTSLEELCLRLNGQFPDEVGCFCAFIFNYLTLLPGEAIYLAANEPHAYIYGECIECMALSDNVVRAGLTPKFRDVDTLIKMLTYKTYKREDLVMSFSKLINRPNSVLYRPPAKEFQVIKTALKLGESEKISSLGLPSILLCVQGDLCISKEEGCRSDHEQKIHVGTIILLGKEDSVIVTSQSPSALLFQASSQ